ELRARAFVDGAIREEYKRNITWLCADVREEMPPGPFELIFCRYLVFTYFAEDLQRELLPRLRARLAPGGEILLGRHERLPAAE
ncbi:MAG: chemotaxis protein CheR, partial [Planctomycetota bacterium]|nr:chemotaxis protein CheR [Planctomycetota bacterium]